MGQKTNPIGFRLIVNSDWRSKWYADKKEFGELLVEDYKIRKVLKDKLKDAAVPRIQKSRLLLQQLPAIYSAPPVLRKSIGFDERRHSKQVTTLEHSEIV